MLVGVCRTGVCNLRHTIHAALSAMEARSGVTESCRDLNDINVYVSRLPGAGAGALSKCDKEAYTNNSADCWRECTHSKQVNWEQNQ